MFSIQKSYFLFPVHNFVFRSEYQSNWIDHFLSLVNTAESPLPRSSSIVINGDIKMLECNIDELSAAELARLRAEAVECCTRDRKVGKTSEGVSVREHNKRSSISRLMSSVFRLDGLSRA